MVTFIKSVTFDCVDALVVAQFWAAALGAVVALSGDELVVMEDPEDNEFCVE